MATTIAQSSSSLLQTLGHRAAKPSLELNLTWSSGVQLSSNQSGLSFTPKDTLSPPEVKLHGADQNAYYALAMIDPDAPSHDNPVNAEYRHWLVVNMHGGNLSGGTQVSTYMGPAPPKGTGNHRYIFLVYKQSEKLQAKKCNDDQRGHFKIHKYAEEHGLGDPVGLAYFTAHHA